MSVLNSRLSQKDLFLIFIILALAIFFRLVYLLDYRNTEVYPLLTYSDAYSYYLWAQDILSGDFWGNKVFMKWPFYAYFLAFLFQISGKNIVFVYAFQFVLGALNCVLIYFIAQTIFNRAVAFMAAGFCAFYGLFIFYDGLLIYNSLSLFLNSLLFLFMLHIQDVPSPKNLFWIGLFLGICTITQAQIILFGILAVIWILQQKNFGFGKLLYNLSYFLAGLSLIIGAVTLRNYLVEKDWVLLAGHGGVNFYLGNGPEVKGRFYSPKYFTLTPDGIFRDARIAAKISLGRDLRPSEVSRFWFQRTAVFIRQNPSAYLKLFFRKIFYFLSPQEAIHDPEYYYLLGKLRIFKILFLDLRFILPLGLLGIFLNLKRFKETALLYIALSTLIFGVILFFVATRYRIAVVPFLAIFAASVLSEISQAIKNKKYLEWGLLIVALCGLYILFNRDVLGRNSKVSPAKEISTVSFIYINKTLYYIEKADYPSAMQQARLAQEIHPDHPFILLSMGSIYYHMEEDRAAEAMFKEVLRLVPFSVDAYYNLGLLYNKEGRFKQAEGMLKQAIFLDPEDLGAHFELAKSYKAQGNFQQAREELEWCLKKINRWRTQEREMIAKLLLDLDKADGR